MHMSCPLPFLGHASHNLVTAMTRDRLNNPRIVEHTLTVHKNQFVAFFQTKNLQGMQGFFLRQFMSVGSIGYKEISGFLHTS